jgi:hypothetical protein
MGQGLCWVSYWVPPNNYILKNEIETYQNTYFRIWFFGHCFHDLGSQLWGLDFHTRGFQDRNLKTFRTWFSRCGISILGPGFHTGGFIVAFGHGHPLVYLNAARHVISIWNQMLKFKIFSNMQSWCVGQELQL